MGLKIAIGKNGTVDKSEEFQNLSLFDGLKNKIKEIG